MTEQQRSDETKKIVDLITTIYDGIKASNDYDELSRYVSAINKVREQILQAYKKGILKDYIAKASATILAEAEELGKGKLAKLKKTTPTTSTVSLYDKIYKMIEQIANELDKITHKGNVYYADTDGIDSLRRSVDQISEALLDKRIRSQLSPVEIENLEDNIAILKSSIRSRMDLAEEIGSRRGSL